MSRGDSRLLPQHVKAWLDRRIGTLAGYAEITLNDAMVWAGRNGATLSGAVDQDIAATNALRRQHHLPEFRIIRSREQPPLPKPSVGGKDKRDTDRCEARKKAKLKAKALTDA